ncbi:MAG: hypothetical protein P8X74_23805 [Reinekea sp.]
MINRSFLLEKAHDVSVVANESWLYDDQTDVNTIPIKGERMPVCMSSAMVTGSKTEAAPGDDDPDPDVEFMY